VGNSIVEPNKDPSEVNPGLNIEGNSLLPFLLAARATVKNYNSRPVFAEGLASSYEAFLKTRKSKNIRDVIDTDDEIEIEIEIEEYPINNWYYDKVEEFISKESKRNTVSHPKISATINKIKDLWLNGEKSIGLLSLYSYW